MKIKKPGKKLALNKKTIATLEYGQIKAVHGGNDSITCTVNFTCEFTCLPCPSGDTIYCQGCPRVTHDPTAYWEFCCM
jgi:hypothetical protein